MRPINRGRPRPGGVSQLDPTAMGDIARVQDAHETMLRLVRNAPAFSGTAHDRTCDVAGAESASDEARPRTEAARRAAARAETSRQRCSVPGRPMRAAFTSCLVGCVLLQSLDARFVLCGSGAAGLGEAAQPVAKPVGPVGDVHARGHAARGQLP